MFSPEYVRLVLNENFEDAKALLLEPLLAIHYAHLVMLAEQEIVASADARRIRDALDRVDTAAVRQAAYDGSCEDLFFYVDRLIVASAGDELGGRLHTARSRNDIDMTMYRMVWRVALLDLADATVALRRALLGIASRHRESIFPAHTHTQPAQPSTLAHYLLGVIEQLERDSARIRAAHDRTNWNPLGACAITGTGFPIDRTRTSELLGFQGPTGNTYGSIAAVDYLLESAAAAGIAAVGAGRFVQDMLLWCTSEVGYLRLPDDLVQISSIMPQKRNPVALEHARALLSKAVAQANGLPLAVHNTPFGDIVDTEDDLQPLIASMFKDAIRGLRLTAVAMSRAEFATEKMAARAREGWVTTTELADTLARDHGLPFKAAHGVATRLVLERRANPDAPLSEVVARTVRELSGRDVHLSEAALERLLSPEHFVAVRRTPGGPAPEVTAQAIDVGWDRLGADAAAVQEARDALSGASAKLEAAVRAL
jgi:argininosuccinate lyase